MAYERVELNKNVPDKVTEISRKTNDYFKRLS